MHQREVVVGNPLGVHARLSASVVYLAARFRSSVSLRFNGRRANATSIIAVMLLAARVGTTVTIEARGSDEYEAVEAIARLIGESRVK